MNPIVLQFANGNIFFVGLGMVVAASALGLRRSGALLRSLLTITSLVGIILVLLSATPLSLWLYGLWLGLSLANFCFGNSRTPAGSLPNYRLCLFSAVVLVSMVLTFVELPYHLVTRIPVSSQPHAYVVGDSLSAGMGAKERAWPAVLGDLAHLNVTNLARPGATAEAALSQSSQITGHDCLIIVEIGGNDLIGGTDGQVFYHQLDRLLGELCSRNNQVIMLEIPLFPFRNGFGRAQRTLAKKYGVALLPKKLLTNVFDLPNATSDGLHFSQVGHDALAKEIFAALSFK